MATSSPRSRMPSLVPNFGFRLATGRTPTSPGLFVPLIVNRRRRRAGQRGVRPA